LVFHLSTIAVTHGPINIKINKISLPTIRLEIRRVQWRKFLHVSRIITP